jgi:sterol desaturase/sphingolipid hydroxylase (fatty acid hydroxylase superfamily)
LWLYFWHRANHAWPVLWRFHQVHHLDQQLDATTALRFHFGEVALSALLRAGVMLLLAVPLASVLVFEVAVAVVSMFHHANLRLPPALHRALAWVVVTPSIHWVHHHALRADTDSSYATLLSVWDRLFGTARRTPLAPDMALGVEGEADTFWLGLLRRPMR